MTESNRTPLPYVSPATPTVIGSAETAANGPFALTGSDGGTDPFVSYNSAV